MRTGRLAALLTTVALASCDPTGPIIQGISGGGNEISPASLGFVVQPSDATAGDIITPTIQVVALDSLGQTDTSFNSNITVALSANPGGAVLSGTKTVAAVNGVAAFGDLTVSKAANGYTLSATAPGLGTATSASFNVAAP